MVRQLKPAYLALPRPFPIRASLSLSRSPSQELPIATPPNSRPSTPVAGILSREKSNILRFHPQISLKNSHSPALSVLHPVTRRGLRRQILYFSAISLLFLSLLLFVSKSLNIDPPPPLHIRLSFNPIFGSKSPPLPPPQPKLKLNAAQIYLANRPPQIELLPAEELATLTQFVLIKNNALPPSVDPLKPIDPELICGFDTRADRARDEIKLLSSEVWAQSPVVLFKELRSPRGREIRTMLEEYNLSPPPIVVEVDTRPDANILSPALFRLTHAQKLPILLVGGKLAAPGISELRSIRQSGELKRMIQKSGAIIDGGRKKKGKK